MATSMGIGSLAAQPDVLQAREDRLLQQAKTLPKAEDATRIDKSARDFESILVGSWLQQAEQSFATVPGGTDDEDAAGREQMMSLGVQSLASSMTALGGIGIAKMVAKSLHAREEKENPPVAAAKQAVENVKDGGFLRK